MMYEILNTTKCARYPYQNETIWNYAKETLIKGIENNAIVWNANSIISFWDATSQHIFNQSLTHFQQLNEQFNKHYGHVFKDTDIPGLSKSIIPYLNKSNVNAIHFGYGLDFSGGNDVPQFATNVELRTLSNSNPANLFIWEHEETNTSVIVMLEYDYGQFILPNSLAN